MATERQRQWSPRRRLFALVGVAIVVAFALLLWLFDIGWIKGYVEGRVALATGRPFEIRGPLHGKLRWTTTVVAEDLHLGNAAWSKTKEMGRAQRIELDLALLPLLIGDYDIRAIRLQRPRLLIERDGEGKTNLDFLDERTRKRGSSLAIGQLTIADGELRVEDAPRRTSLRLQLDSTKVAEGETAVPTQVQGSGRYRGFDFALNGTVASPLALRDRDKPYTLDVEARAGGTRARLAGSVVQPLRFDGLDARFELSGPDIADLYPLLEVALPSSPPYDIAGRLHHEDEVWRYVGYSGRVGDSDVAGDVTVDARRERTRMTATVASRELDFDDLAPLFGAPPQTGDGETASPEQRRAAAELAASPHVLPTREYDLARLRAMDADFTLQAASIRAPSLPLHGGDAHATLKDGVLDIDTLDLRAAGGHVGGSVRLDATRDVIDARTELTLRGLGLAQLFPGIDLGSTEAGRISGRVDLRGQGNSVARMLATADGEIGAVMGRGQISNLLIELAGLDIAESLKFMIGKDRSIPIRCAYADFAVQDGVMQSRALVFDTTDSAIHGELAVNLQDETVDGRLRVEPKDRSLLSLRTPLKIDGTLKDPSIGPEGKALALRGIATAVLYSLAPPAALVTLVETGPGERADCGPARAAATSKK